LKSCEASQISLNSCAILPGCVAISLRASDKKARQAGSIQMKVGVPKEIKAHEYRVGLTPGAAREYVAAGHRVMIETNAGAGIGATDGDYRNAGATILTSAAEVFASSEMIVKVKEPQPAEWSQLREDQILFTYLHLAQDPEQAAGLLKSGCIAIAYETVTDAHGGLPLLAPMSEVAGRLSIEAAGSALTRPIRESAAFGPD
jgi:alanine dehydrogenase